MSLVNILHFDYPPLHIFWHNARIMMEQYKKSLMLIERLNRAKAFWFPNLPKEDRLAFWKDVTHTNLSREWILGVVMILALLILMTIDCVIGRVTPELYDLSICAILYRALMVSILVIFLIVQRRSIPIDEITTRHQFLDVGVACFGLAWTSLLTGALQLVRPGIEPYMIAVFVVAAFIFQGGLRSSITFGACLIILTVSMWHFQANPRIVIAQLVNGTLFTILAIFISRAVFVFHMREFLNGRTIRDQKLALEEAILQLAESNEMLKRLTAIDPLTGISNRRFLEEAFKKEWKRQMREGRALSVIMVDIDQFKSFNDSYGHLAGDECLKLVAATLQKSLRRPSDLVARFGGEEFVALLPQTDRKGALFVAKRMTDAVAALNIQHIGSPPGRLAISTGVGTCRPGKDLDPEGSHQGSR